MKKTKFSAALIISGLLLAGSVYADVDQVIRDSLKKTLPGVEVDEINVTPIPGLHEVLVGSSLFYVSDDGKHLIQGEITELETRVNLSKNRKSAIRAKTINEVDEKQMIIFAADKSQHTVTVFTDIDCGYCRKLHNEIPSYNEKGITVRYMLFPRNGINTPSYKKAVTVWCSENQRTALTEAKAGKALLSIACDNPVKDQFTLGKDIGVSGTPAIILPNGELVPGYVPASTLANLLKDQS